MREATPGQLFFYAVVILIFSLVPLAYTTSCASNGPRTSLSRNPPLNPLLIDDADAQDPVRELLDLVLMPRTTPLQPHEQEQLRELVKRIQERYDPAPLAARVDRLERYLLAVHAAAVKAAAAEGFK